MWRGSVGGPIGAPTYTVSSENAADALKRHDRVVDVGTVPFVKRALSPIESSLSQESLRERVRARRGKRVGWRRTVVLVREWLSPKSRCFRMGAGRAGRQRRSWVALPGLWLSSCVKDQLAIHRVADLSFQRADRFFLGLAVGDFAVEVRAAVGVRLADLTDRGEVQGMVEAPVAAL